MTASVNRHYAQGFQVNSSRQNIRTSVSVRVSKYSYDQLKWLSLNYIRARNAAELSELNTETI